MYVPVNMLFFLSVAKFDSRLEQILKLVGFFSQWFRVTHLFPYSHSLSFSPSLSFSLFLSLFLSLSTISTFLLISSSFFLLYFCCLYCFVAFCRIQLVKHLFLQHQACPFIRLFHDQHSHRNHYCNLQWYSVFVVVVLFNCIIK